MAGRNEVISMEELHERRKVVRKEASQASRGSDQPVIVTEEAETQGIVVQVEATSSSTSSREERFKSVMNAEDVNASQSQTPNTRIYLKPLAETYCLKDVSFKSHFFHGDLQLPPIMVEDSTRAKFLNLIAYEMSPDVANNLEVTSYICFLDSLIDHPEDVKQLRAAGILHNFLGSDEEVAKLFNEITTNLVPNSDIYKDVKREIQKHYDNRLKTWWAQLKHEHFRYPWSIFAFGGAVLVILFTVIQTYFTIRPLPSDCDGLCKILKKQYI